ncbi:MAG: amino acid carrier protein [Oscillospiraceae bacterium]|nr:amino acid carrier protein [Oscillospiraceae bacterium]
MPFVEAINRLIWGPAALGAFMAVGLLYSVRSRWFQVRGWRLWLAGTLGSLFRRGGARKSRDGVSLSQLQAMSAALAATAGTGNIAGVASALALGGPGAIFWMWVSAFLGMMTGFAENALGILYRRRGAGGQWEGGPMGYIERGLGLKPLARLYALFCVLASFGIGNMTQVNSLAAALSDSFAVPPAASGLVTAALAGLVILGGLRRVASVTELLVPLMVVVYSGGMLACLFLRAGAIPDAFALILREAFTLRGAAGGAAGYGILQAMRMGVSRGVFSNEAGLGSSVIVHSASDAKTPAEQGLWSMFEVFADTLVMCTLTALVILTSGVYDPEAYAAALRAGRPVAEGAALTARAVSASLGPAGGVFVSASLTLFAFATLLGWSCYGERGAAYLAGEQMGARAVTVYRVCFIAAVVVGAVSGLRSVWAVSDMFNGLMAAPNLLALALLNGKAVKALREYA